MIAALWTQDATSNVVAAVAVIAISGVGTWGVWSFKKWLEGFITERTAPIQKEANGGWSLPDAIRMLQGLDKKVDGVVKDVAHLRGRFDQHVEEGE